MRIIVALFFIVVILHVAWMIGIPIFCRITNKKTKDLHYIDIMFILVILMNVLNLVVQVSAMIE